jgi:hypothetical protein
MSGWSDRANFCRSINETNLRPPINVDLRRPLARRVPTVRGDTPNLMADSFCGNKRRTGRSSDFLVKYVLDLRLCAGSSMTRTLHGELKTFTPSGFQFENDGYSHARDTGRDTPLC